MIEVSNLTYSYGKAAALRQVSLRMNNGKIYGIFGKEGTGKSTLLALLAGALHPTEGKVRINGFDTVTEHRAATRCLGYAPSYSKFYQNTSVYELLDFVAETKGVSDERRFLHVHKIMEQVGLEPIRDRLISKLSNLDLACLRLAQALVGSPDILLLDEPTAGLPHAERKMLLDLIKEIATDGKTVFYASSIPTQIVALCSEVILINDGSAEPPQPLAELLNGTEMQIEVRGEREAAEQALSEVEGLFSCRRLGNTDGILKYTVKGEGVQLDKKLENALLEKGCTVTSVTVIPPSEAASAFCAALRSARSKKEGERK